MTNSTTIFSTAVLAVVLGLTTGIASAQNVDLETFSSSAGNFYTGGMPDSGNKQIVSAAGDFNGDGYDDFVVGAALDSSMNGAAYVVFGKPGGAGASLNFSEFATSNANGFSITSNIQRAFGRCVSSAGDFNNDGFDDLLIGNYNSNSWVIFGKANPTNISLASFVSSNTTGFRINGENIGDYAGLTVTGLGDVNKDGYDDVAIGAPFYDNATDKGQVYVLFGKATGIATVNLASFTTSDTNGFRVTSNSSSGMIGQGVASAGDFNGDGFADFITTNFTSQMTLILGRASGFADVNLSDSPLPANVVRFNLNIGSLGQYEWPFDGSGDFNGDGFTDIVFSLGTRTGKASNIKSAGVIFGRASISSPYDVSSIQTAGTDGFCIDGVADEGLGTRVTYAGDVNGDGRDDLILTANSADPMGRTNAGSVYLVYGKPAVASHIDLAVNFTSGVDGYRVDRPAPGMTTQAYISGAGDFNKDGMDDFLVTRHRSNPVSGQNPLSDEYLVFGKATPAASITDWELWQ